MAVMRIHNIIVFYIVYMVLTFFFSSFSFLLGTYGKNSITIFFFFSVLFLEHFFFEECLYVSIRKVKALLQASVIYHS